MSEDCCCIDVESDRPSVLRQEVRLARQVHTCGECGDLIRPGDSYEYVTGLWDGWWSTYRTCSFCLKIRRDFFPCGFYYERLRDDFRECMGWDYTAPVEELDDDDE
jgi:hypothetical protein